jgi:hypothetical protein
MLLLNSLALWLVLGLLKSNIFTSEKYEKTIWMVLGAWRILFLDITLFLQNLEIKFCMIVEYIADCVHI